MTHYELLNVTINATQEEIHKAYLSKSFELHPDRNLDDIDNAKKKFIELQKAYECLFDFNKRAAYNASLPKKGPSWNDLLKEKESKFLTNKQRKELTEKFNKTYRSYSLPMLMKEYKEVGAQKYTVIGDLKYNILIDIIGKKIGDPAFGHEGIVSVEPPYKDVFGRSLNIETEKTKFKDSIKSYIGSDSLHIR